MSTIKSEIEQILSENTNFSPALLNKLQVLADEDARLINEWVEPDIIEEPVPVFTHTVASVPVYIEVSGSYQKVSDFHAVNRLLKDGTSTEPEILHIARNSTVTIGMEQIEGVANQLVELGYEITGKGEMRDNRWLFVELEHSDLPNFEISGTMLVPKVWIGSSHDGTLAMKSTVKVVDTVCLNTFMMNATSDLLFKAKHTKNADARIKDYERGLLETGELLQQYYKSVLEMANTPFSYQNTEKYFAKVVGAEKKPRTRRANGNKYETLPEYSGKHKNQLIQLQDSWTFGEGQVDRGENVWRLFSSVTDWCDNHEANKQNRSQGSHLLGNRARQKQNAFNLALGYTNQQ